eukprot:8073197-Pyramimonas_sp.AAC.1
MIVWHQCAAGHPSVPADTESGDSCLMRAAESSLHAVMAPLRRALQESTTMATNTQVAAS